MTSFATELSERFLSNDAFWAEYRFVRAAGASNALGLSDEPADPSEGAIKRLMFTASVFAQSDRESDLAVAQSIALSALFASRTPAVYESATSILAQIGNFPGVAFVKEHFPSEGSPTISELQQHLLKEINTVETYGSSRALTDFQMDVWRALPELSTASISAPTSAGKSFVVMEYLCKSISESARFVAFYVAPTRALLGEVHRKLAAKLQGVNDIRISTVPSIDSDGRPRQLYVLTQERLSVLLAISDIEPDLVIVDEAQNISDGARGMILQDCLERVRERAPRAQLLLLSPGATGFPGALKTFGIDGPVLKETMLSPVLQNRIVVSPVSGDAHALELALLEKGSQTPLGKARTTRGVSSAETRLAAVALELGGGGATLVYATGPADAEKVAARLVNGLPRLQNDRLTAISDFIKAHIHEKYGLAEMVLHGVAFHYGKMPSLLREAIEHGFQEGHIKFLVCTTTLFQGVNLPARNVFINTPTRGKGVLLDPALLWNFAGRAGRLSKDVVGNVFLVDYNSWVDQPLDKQVQINVVPSLTRIVGEHTKKLVAALEGDMPKDARGDDTPAQVRAAAGYLLSRAARGSVELAVSRIPGLKADDAISVVDAATSASMAIGLPASVLEANWTVDAFGLARLRARLAELVATNEIDDVLPCEPSDERAFKVYVRIFNLIAREVLGWEVTTFGAFVANYALLWMRGAPYPVLIAKWVKNKSKGKDSAKSIDPLIRQAFDFIEDELRFKWVQHGKAYMDVITEVLREASLSELRPSVYDFSLALELGVSTTTARSLIDIGLSRIAASTISSLLPDSALSTDAARDMLRSMNIKVMGLSPVIVRELVDLELIGAEQEVGDGSQ